MHFYGPVLGQCWDFQHPFAHKTPIWPPAPMQQAWDHAKKKHAQESGKPVWEQV